MALIATGFVGDTDSTDFAPMQLAFGAEHDIEGINDYAVSISTTGDRTVRVAPGVANGGGVRVVNDAPILVQLDPVASGFRWDLICLRRNWANAGSVQVTKVTGSTLEMLPPDRETRPGEIDDQPLALVRVQAGQTAPTKVLDFRYTAKKIITAKTTLALPRKLGVEAQIGESRWRCEEVNGALVFVEYPAIRADFVEHQTARPVVAAPNFWHAAPSDLTAGITLPVRAYRRELTADAQLLIQQQDFDRTHLDGFFRLFRDGRQVPDESNRLDTGPRLREVLQLTAAGPLPSKPLSQSWVLDAGIPYELRFIGDTAGTGRALVTTDSRFTFMRSRTRGVA